MIKFNDKKMTPKQYAQEVLKETLLVYIENCICSDDRGAELSEMTDKERVETIRQIDLLVSRAMKAIGKGNE
jgi:hypothetical protein